VRRSGFRTGHLTTPLPAAADRELLNQELTKIEKPAGIANPKSFRTEIVKFSLRRDRTRVAGIRSAPATRRSADARTSSPGGTSAVSQLWHATGHT
jgi:hypothetical protein